MPQTFRLEWNGPQVKADARDGAAQGLRDAVEHLLGEAQTLVPHETGWLEGTGTASVDDAGLRGAVSFDGPYAVIQHEAMDFRHDSGRRAKYLETPLQREQQVMAELIAAAVRRSLQ